MYMHARNVICDIDSGRMRMKQPAVAAYSEILMTKEEETLYVTLALGFQCVDVAFSTRICFSLSFPEVYLSRYCFCF